MLELSSLAKIWILDVDGTIVKHNGHKIDGFDTLLPGVKEFFENLSPQDKVVLLTAREGVYLEDLKNFLKKNNLRYDYLLCDMPVGERILVNDAKPSGLKTAFAINLNRDAGLELDYKICTEI